MPAFELVTPMATFRASLRVSTFFHQNDLICDTSFSWALDRRIKEIQTAGCVFYEARALSLVLHRVEYVSLHANVNLNTDFLSIGGNRKGGYSYHGDMSEAARKMLKTQIGAMLLDYAKEQVAGMQSHYMSELFSAARSQITGAEHTLQQNRRKLEARALCFSSS